MAIILGIESSCDETGVAIYSHENGLIANKIYTQIPLHQEYGGVVPELASRDHIKRIIPLIDEAIKEANINKTDINAISYTNGPGLNGALLVGSGVAVSIGYALNIPVIPIHHMEGHLLSTLLSDDNIEAPFIALLVSGGHSQIIKVTQIGEYELIGDTLDDAAGEAFDKTAKMLGLPYPGGKYIAELALKAKHDIYNLPRPMLHSKDLQMSFSGLKTAVLTLINTLTKNQTILDEATKANLSLSIEEAITDVLVSKIELASKITGIKKVVISGGVSSNLKLRNKFDKISQLKTYYPPLKFCTDNGAMIAIAGAIRYNLRKYDYKFNVKPRFKLTELDKIP